MSSQPPTQKESHLRIMSFCFLSAIFTFTCLTAFSQTPYLHAPAINEYARHDPNGTTILPTGRLLKPAGRHYPVAQWPHGLAMSPDGSSVFVASEGVGQLISGWDEQAVKTVTLSPDKKTSRRG